MLFDTHNALLFFFLYIFEQFTINNGGTVVMMFPKYDRPDERNSQ